MRVEYCVAWAIVAAAMAWGQAAPPGGEEAAELVEELGLDPAQRERFGADVEWTQEQREGLRERLISGEMDFDRLPQERAMVRTSLRKRLASYLTPDQLERVPWDDLIEGPTPPPRAWVEVGTTWMPSTRLRRGGRLSLLQTTAEFQASVPLNRTLSLSLGLRGSVLRNEFSKATELDPASGDPFETIYGGRATLGMQVRLGPIFAIASTNVQLAFEEGADANDAITYGGLLGVSYAFSRSFALGLGAIVRSRIEDDVQVIPIPFIRLDLELSESWRFLIGAPEGLQLIWAPDPSFQAQVGIGFRGGIAQDARLDDDGVAPEGVARGRRIPVQLRLRWRPTEFLQVGADAGVFLWQKIQIDDRRGNELSADRSDPTPFGALSLRLLF